MTILLIILSLIIILLFLKIFTMKKSLRNISQQIYEKFYGDTNTVIDVSSSDKDICYLASCLNKNLKVFRSEFIRYKNGDSELKEIITNISHDLRTPLTAICGYLDLMKKEEKSQKTDKYINIISERAEIMKQLTDELLKYSVTLSSECNTMNKEDVILNNILEESILAFYAVLKENNINPEIEICDKKIHRMLDKNALIRIFSNIISNAIKYSTGDFKIKLNVDGEIVFSNHADNLDEVSAGKLFNRFYTVENAGKSTGLGLSIAKQLTEQMNGIIYSDYIEDTLNIYLIFP